MYLEETEMADEKNVEIEELNKKVAEDVSELKSADDQTDDQKYLTFKLASEIYGLEILRVREIIGVLPITRVPRMPEHVRGVINLRGKVIPVIDLRTKFGMEMAEETSETCIIVVDAEDGSGDVLIGILVDSVSEVLDISAGNIEDPPEMDSTIDTGYISGMGKAADKVIILLDIVRVLDTQEISIQ
jgi:purine-binding chemotaxis protein CheW